MAKLNELHSGSRKIVKELINKEINCTWLRNILLEKTGIQPDGRGGASLVDHFEAILWDNLSPKQQSQVIEATNKVLEEDLFKEIHRYEDYANVKDERELPDPFYEGSYWDRLVGLACMLEGKMPGLIKKETLLKWREENYPNFRTDVSKKSVNEKIEASFLPKLSLKHRFDSSFNSSKKNQCKGFIDGKEASHWEYTWSSLRKPIEPKKLQKFTGTFNELLQEGITQDIIYRENYIQNLLESCCYIEKYAPGYIDKEKVLSWYNSGYEGVNFDEETKTKLNKLIEENFLKN